MFIKSIKLQNFRNYREKVFSFDKDTTLIVGPNASGKTNLLEAIYLLATGKSFRAE
ncbi:DNA replication and repair protein RecF, partial [Candidatus Shapirobacteria bacterium]|nr:DNA replication and repair protein RecF [Candidatus Shapirobacteria bacterium]